MKKAMKAAGAPAMMKTSVMKSKKSVMPRQVFTFRWEKLGMQLLHSWVKKELAAVAAARKAMKTKDGAAHGAAHGAVHGAAHGASLKRQFTR